MLLNNIKFNLIVIWTDDNAMRNRGNKWNEKCLKVINYFTVFVKLYDSYSLLLLSRKIEYEKQISVIVTDR